MKTYNLDEIKQLLNKKGKLYETQFESQGFESQGREELKNIGPKYLIAEEDNKEKFNYDQPINEIEEFDSAKTRILKYVFYKKRTEQEIRTKFLRIYKKDLLDDVIDELKKLNYINDDMYIDRAVKEYTALNNLSLTEIKYKLLKKGIKSDSIDNYFSNNYDSLIDFERQSAKNLIAKKSNTMDCMQIRMYLKKKGYKEESIKEAL